MSAKPRASELRTFEDTTFLLLIVAISLVFAWIVWPLYGAVLWASVMAIVFAPLHRKLSKLIGPRRNLVALSTVLIIVAIVIVPLIIVGASLLQEATSLYERIQSGDLNLVRLFRQVLDGLPEWAANIMRRLGLTSLGAAQETLSASAIDSSQFLANKAVNIGQITTGAVWQGVALVAYGALVIGLVDNVLRPVLVGRDTKMPEYVVLISTLGGITMFGFNGLVIGPVIAAMFIASWDIFSEARQGAHNDQPMACPTSRYQGLS